MKLFMLPVVALLASALPALAQSVADPPVVVTIGEAVVKRAPDRAWITVTAESRAPSPKEAQELNARRMSDVMAKLQSARIEKDAIQTVAYDLQPEYDYTDGKQVLRGFLARNSVEVRVDDLARLGNLLDLVVSAGATSASGVRFDLKDREGIQQEALKQAVADARKRAEAAAAGARLAVQRILKIEEHRVTDAPPPRPYAMAMRAEMAEATTPIAPGEIEIRASVTLTAEVK